MGLSPSFGVERGATLQARQLLPCCDELPDQGDADLEVSDCDPEVEEPDSVVPDCPDWLDGPGSLDLPAW